MIPEQLNIVPKQLVLSVSLIVINILAAWLINVLYNQIYSSQVTFVTAPSDLSVSINGVKKDIKPNTAIRLKPGEYNLVAQKNNFDKYSGKISVGEKKQEFIPVQLTPSTPIGEKELSSEENQSSIQDIYSLKYTANEESYKDIAILKRLPVKSLLFSIYSKISQSAQAGDPLTIEVNAPYGYREAAITLIKNWGYDPSVYNIQFTGDYNNPFSS